MEDAAVAPPTVPLEEPVMKSPRPPAEQPEESPSLPLQATSAPPPPDVTPPTLLQKSTWADGLVDGHNQLAQKLCDVQQQLSAGHAYQVKSSEELRSLAELQRQQKASQCKRIEELERQNNEMHEALKVLVQQQATTLEEKQTQAIQALDVTISPKLQALERALQDLATAQSETTSRTLPRWREDCGAEIQKLSAELEASKKQAEQRDRELDTRLTEQAAALNTAKVSSDQRINSEVAELRSHLLRADEGIAALQSSLAAVDTKFDSSICQLQSNFQVQCKDMEKISENKVTIDDLKNQLDTLESVVKQGEFERLRLSDRLTRDIEKLNGEIANSQTEAAQRLTAEASLQSHIGKVEAMNVAMEERFAAEVNNLSTRISAADNAAQALSKALQESDSRLSNGSIHLTQQLDSSSTRLEEVIKAEVKSVVAMIQANEGARLGELEARFAEEKGQHLAEAERFAQDLAGLRADWNAGRQESDRKGADYEESANKRMQLVQEAVDDLAQLFQEFGQMQDKRNVDLDSVMQQMHDLETRLMPWRTRNRSTSPTATAARKPPSKPGSRPVSASHGRKDVDPTGIDPVAPVSSTPAPVPVRLGNLKGLMKPSSLPPTMGPDEKGLSGTSVASASTNMPSVPSPTADGYPGPTPAGTGLAAARHSTPRKR